MSSQAEVRQLAAAALDAYPRLDVLVNNVGGFWARRHKTPDGLERTFALNHLAPFLLATLLLDRLKATAPARVVTVSSHVEAEGRIDFIGGLVSPMLKSPAQGAETSIYLASSPTVEGVSGRFFSNRKPKVANRDAYNADMAARLWQVSAALVGDDIGRSQYLASECRIELRPFTAE
jgi:NAD(P)-dependent dehydrogenase (short-subunit alcohol dehydrogenase family)